MLGAVLPRLQRVILRTGTSLGLPSTLSQISPFKMLKSFVFLHLLLIRPSGRFKISAEPQERVCVLQTVLVDTMLILTRSCFFHRCM
jgi:hypothetical protein